MSKQVRIEFVSEGFHEILASDGVKSAVGSAAANIKRKAEEGTDGQFYQSIIMGGYGGGRWIGFVGTVDEAAAIAESEHKVLTKAVNS